MRRAANIDTSSKPLVAHLKTQGIGYAHVGGAFDGLAFLLEVAFPVEWKTPGKETLTPAQLRLIAKGCPVKFLSTPEQVEALANKMKAMAAR